jgi:hypothetical protein
MEAAGLTSDQFTRLSAVDGRALSVEELRNQSTKLAMYLQPRGVIGCYLSHRRFWQLVVDQRLPRAIVLEDDIVLVEGFTDKLRTNLQAADEEQAQEQGEADGDAYDVLFLGAIGEKRKCTSLLPVYQWVCFWHTFECFSNAVHAVTTLLSGRVHPQGRDDFGSAKFPYIFSHTAPC